MSERKVINKWLDPEFDPSRIVLEKARVKNICTVRMMLPMTVRCLNCDNYMYIGTKFNMRMETLLDEDYLGIKIYRFYFKCTKCYCEVTFKTDPRNHDYICEQGLKRKHQNWKDMELAEEEYKERKNKEMKEDAMKSLEYKKYDTQIEMDIMDAIEQVRNINKRHGMLDINDSVLEIIKTKDKEEKEDIENKENDSVFNKEYKEEDDEEFKEEVIKKKIYEAKNKRINDYINDDIREENNAVGNKGLKKSGFEYYSKYEDDSSEDNDEEVGRKDKAKTKFEETIQKSSDICNRKILNSCFNKKNTNSNDKYRERSRSVSSDSSSNSEDIKKSQQIRNNINGNKVTANFSIGLGNRNFLIKKKENKDMILLKEPLPIKLSSFEFFTNS